MKTANMTDKLHAEETLSIAKQKVKQEEVSARKKDVNCKIIKTD